MKTSWVMFAAAICSGCTPEVRAPFAVQFSTFTLHIPRSVMMCPLSGFEQKGVSAFWFWVDQVSPSPNATHCDRGGTDNTGGIVIDNKYPTKSAGDIRIADTKLAPELVSEKVLTATSTNPNLLSRDNILSPAEGYVVAPDALGPVYSILYQGQPTGVIYSCHQDGTSECGLAFRYKSAVAGYRWYPNAWHNHVSRTLPQILQMAVDLNRALGQWSS